jgi:sugar phosphate permease
MVSFFHRVAPVSLSAELQQSFHASSAELGTVSAVFFFAVMAMQIPTGVLADTLGPRKILFAGCLASAVGAFMFAASTSIFTACVGRGLIGVGAAVPFVALLRLNASWFEARQFATLSGLTILFGNLGSILSTAPLEHISRIVDWRIIIDGTGIVSLVTGLLILIFVRDGPAAIGLPSPIAASRPAGESWRSQLLVVLRNPRTWPCFWVGFGICGTFFTYTSLWAVPFLVKTRGFDRQDASLHVLVMVVVHAMTALVLGRLSDRMGNRKGLLTALAALYTVMWLPMFFPLDLFPYESYAVFALQGIGSTSYTLIWAIAKEVNPVRSAGIAVGVANTSMFLAAALLQPAIGALMDKFGDALGVSYSLALLVAVSLAGLVSALRLVETRGRNVHNEKFA